MTERIAGFEVATLVVAARGAGQDRVAIVDGGDALLVALADGAGGTGGGDLAADAIVGSLAGLGADAQAHLEALDDPRVTAGGQATAVVARVTAAGIAGASVGDSIAWIVDEPPVDLTRFQVRKPLLGNREAIVTPFAHGPWRGTLLLASDGLATYARRADLARLVGGAGDLDAIAARLVDRVRLASGGLPDDVSIILVRAG